MSNVWIELGLSRLDPSKGTPEPAATAATPALMAPIPAAAEHTSLAPRLVADLLQVIGDMAPDALGLDTASFRQQLHVDERPTTPADNDVLYGIRTVASLFGSEQLFVSSHCPGVLNEVPGYSWDGEASKKGEDKPVKVADHSLDAMRYAVTTTESLWRSLLTV